MAKVALICVGEFEDCRVCGEATTAARTAISTYNAQ